MDETRMQQLIASLALKLQGVPYIWGGAVPQVGFDCSGFCIWVLQVFGRLPSGDWTAQGLHDLFPVTISAEPGDLAFYGAGVDKVTHVMMVVGSMNGKVQVVGASGGGSDTTTREIAEAKGARVKLKSYEYRRDFIGFASTTEKDDARME